MNKVETDTLSTMTSSFRIAHISDTHVSPEYNRHNVGKLKNILAYVVDNKFDHIAITGDITGNGEYGGYRSVRRVLKYFDLLNYDKLSVTIGNHDIFGGVHRAEDLFTFGSRCRLRDYGAQVKMFERSFKETFPNKAYKGESPFPFVKIVGPVALIGLNSISRFHAIWNPVGSNGRIEDDQLEEVERILLHPSISALKKIVLIHHHFNKYQPHSDSFGTTLYHKFEAQTLKLYGKDRIEELFSRSGVDAVLHGHTHIEGVYSRSGMMFSSAALNPVRDRVDIDEPATDTELLFNEISVSSEGTIVVSRRRAFVHHKGTSSQAIDQKHYS